MANTKLEQMISIAIQEAADSWRVAQASTTQVHEWKTRSEAESANYGFSFSAFCQNKRGNWVIA
jgi:hypothetical protein